MTKRKTHLLKNGHPAHVFTDEDRRKAAARTNSIRRAKRQALEDEKFERAIAEMLARDDARRARKSRLQRQRYERKKREQVAPAPPYEPDLSGYEQPEAEKVATWLERGYGAVTDRDRRLG